ncbi:DNA-3-methyladenine glycosylase [Intrasporangium calvum]|uniref:Putative 3-methyladenine DNA glycosylase n=1 Tax=Intrasporangium calvum TaxID=53358 RepID=A0ABT5GKQ5_9MICO|nr:DNA-3-methyladenine glycosylase [Intrasporangium calvum]MDC5698817.1 DNA-3-methyladenine glycosylase [Intrasporangium calvum]
MSPSSRTSRLARDFFDRDVHEVSRDLLGARVSHDGVTVRITEVEAYGGIGDPGAHAFRGKTPRNAVLFDRPGSLYVYFTYGMHFCSNLVAGPHGQGAAVLLRAGEVIDGEDRARERRDVPGKPPVPARDLARGPARLAVTLGLSRPHNGLDTVAPDCPVLVSAPNGSVRGPVRTGPRVGVTGPGGDGDVYPWRYWLEGEPTVSAYRPGVLRKRRTRP